MNDEQNSQWRWKDLVDKILEQTETGKVVWRMEEGMPSMCGDRHPVTLIADELSLRIEAIAERGTSARLFHGFLYISTPTNKGMEMPDPHASRLYEAIWRYCRRHTYNQLIKALDCVGVHA